LEELKTKSAANHELNINKYTHAVRGRGHTSRGQKNRNSLESHMG